MRKILPILILTILMLSCQQSPEDTASYMIDNMEEEMIPKTGQSLTSSPEQMVEVEKQEVIKKRIIKDGRLELIVSELEKTKSHIGTILKNHGGYFSNERYRNSDRESSYDLKIRIPSANFEGFLVDIETIKGELLYKEIDARDVTDQFIDLETRLQSKRNYRIRYNDLLKKANSVKEILEIEEEIRALEEEIESTTGRLKYLSDLVDYSTLDLTITKLNGFKYTPAIRDKFSERLKQSLAKGWFGFVDLLFFSIKIWPLWIMVSLAFYFWKKYKRNKNKN
jgi:hypothetical protein